MVRGALLLWWLDGSHQTDRGLVSRTSPCRQDSAEVFLVYVCNAQKLALGLEGVPNPTYEQVDAAVTARDYKGFVSLEYHVEKAGGGGGETPDEIEPDPEAGKSKRAKK